jgi:hypothetical protein
MNHLLLWFRQENNSVGLARFSNYSAAVRNLDSNTRTYSDPDTSSKKRIGKFELEVVSYFLDQEKDNNK